MLGMREYRIAAAVVALLGGAGGYAYGQSLGIAPAQLIPMLAAFLLEALLYLGCGFDAVRRTPPKWALAASAPLSYLIYTLPLGLASLQTLVILLALGAAVVWWFDAVPESLAPDLLLMVLLAAVYIGGVFQALYPDLHPKVPMSTLGHLMWVRMALVTLLNRNPVGIHFSFIPTAHEWRIGALHFLAFLPAGGLVMALAHYGTFELARGWWYKALIGFVGAMLLIAASEEVLFRGVLQQRFMRWWGEWPGLIAVSVVFGLVHLPFRHQFPNWPHVALTLVLALFLGRAYIKGEGVRAPMVAHALAVAAGRAIGL
jgi:membrane protease YdiL (CAAX protease family)